MKCQFCGKEGLIQQDMGKTAQIAVVYNPKDLAYYAVKPRYYLICLSCGKTDMFSSCRRLSTQEMESMHY